MSRFKELIQCISVFNKHPITPFLRFLSATGSGSSADEGANAEDDGEGDRNYMKDFESSRYGLNRPTARDVTRKELSFFQGGTHYEGLIGRKAKRRTKDPLNVGDAFVPWVDDWYRTRQGAARIQLLAERTDLSIDQVQERISKLLSVAPGLKQFMPLLHPRLFTSILKHLAHSFEIMTMLKTELPAIDIDIVISGFPRVLTWPKELLYDALCFLVVHYDGRMGAAEALNSGPMRLKFTRQLLPVLFADRASKEATTKFVFARVYHFHKRKKYLNARRNRIVFFETHRRLRE